MIYVFIAMHFLNVLLPVKLKIILACIKLKKNNIIK